MGRSTPSLPEYIEAQYSPPPEPPTSSAINLCISQWSDEANDCFRPCGPNRRTIPSGVYMFRADQNGIFLQKMQVLSDTLIPLEDSVNERILASITKFWNSELEYTSRGILYKRGLLLHGPAGSGKTATITLLSQELVQRGGVVIICNEPNFLTLGLPIFRRIEPKRPLIVIFEDIEEMIQNYGEHRLLAILDGELQISNVVNLASTNYPEQLGARIANRPSRFDERILVGMPSESARLHYLRWITRNEVIEEKVLQDWVAQTNGFSIAHLRELAVAVFCLKQDYDDVVVRLKELQRQVHSKPEFGGKGAGFTGKSFGIP